MKTMNVLRYLKGLGERLICVPLFLVVMVLGVLVWVIAGSAKAGEFVDWIRERL
jgi:hypothetical protein